MDFKVFVLVGSDEGGENKRLSENMILYKKGDDFI